jgi:hypothetical protein
MAFSGVALCCVRVWRAVSQREQLLAQYRIDQLQLEYEGVQPYEREQLLNSENLLSRECIQNC